MTIWIKALIIAAIVAASVIAYNAFTKHHQEIGYQRAVAEFREQENKDLKAAMAETIRLNGKIQEAEDAAKLREAERNTLNARIDSLNGQLRDTKSSINRLVSSASADALRKATATFNELFAECRDAYAEMGRAAEGHSSDVRTLTDAWPRSGQ